MMATVDPVNYANVKCVVVYRHLLTHTGGLSNWSSKFALLPKTKVRESKPVIHDDVLDAFHFQLVREPGTEFEYAYGLDFAGKMVRQLRSTLPLISLSSIPRDTNTSCAL